MNYPPPSENRPFHNWQSAEWDHLLEEACISLGGDDELSPYSQRDRLDRLSTVQGANTMKNIPAGVLLPLVKKDDEVFLVLTKRSNDLRHHKGQIAFPGGKVDLLDATVLAAAVRETHEEIGICPGQIVPFGKLPLYETGTGFIISPMVAKLDPPYIYKREIKEVDEIFEVPLAHIANLKHYERRAVCFEGIERHFWVLDYKDYYIWGATAAILNDFACRMDKAYKTP